MNPVVSAQLKAFRATNPSVTLDDTDLFEVFSAFSVINGQLTNNVDPFAVHLKSKEFGLDGVAILVQGELCRTTEEVNGVMAVGKNHDVEFVVLQAKTSEKVDYGDLSKFFDAVHDFFSNSFVEPTPQVVDLIEAKNAVYDRALKQNPTLRLFYVTTGTGELSKQIEQLIVASRTHMQGLNIFDEIEI